MCLFIYLFKDDFTIEPGRSLNRDLHLFSFSKLNYIGLSSLFNLVS